MKNTSTPDFSELKSKLHEIAHLTSVLALLQWDQEVNMPSRAADARAATIAEISALIHGRLLGLNENNLLEKLKKQVDAKAIKGRDAVVILETWRTFERENKLPESFVRELAEVTSKAQSIWAEARKANNFKLFLPWLVKIVALKQREAEYVGYKNSPYDALIDQFEPGMTADEAAKILDDLKDFLVPFLAKIKKSKKKINPKRLKGIFPLDKQLEFNKHIVGKMGFDFEAGRIDTSTHPFATGLHPEDVRITSRYKTDELFYSVGSTIHEAGHGLYEQGLPSEHFGTPLAEAISLGIHESQSRMWENIIGKSKAFWRHFYPKLQKDFPKPYKTISFEDFYSIINNVTSSLIRMEADEVTYNLHVILRFEIEKEMIEGTIDLKELPKIWKAKMKQYFGIEVPSDALGVMQDVHWSCGLIGYFPTYAFGNLYSVQFYDAMKKAIPDIDKKIARGEFAPLREWLRTHIHAHGKTYTAAGLVKKVTGEEINSAHFIEYLKRKYGEIYHL
jgi:carboxypeptidase Taq